MLLVRTEKATKSTVLNWLQSWAGCYRQLLYGATALAQESGRHV